MKAVVLTCFESDEERMRLVINGLMSEGFEVVAYTSNFSHIRKQYRNNIPEGIRAIDTFSYKRNLSFSRLYSHYSFAKSVFKRVKEDKPDLLYVLAPANSLIKEAYEYKKTNKVKLIIDIIDMWPESLPVNKRIKNLFPFRLWRSYRSKYLNCADRLITECSLYREILKDEYKGEIDTLYWARDIKAVKYDLDLGDNLSLLYIGSINNIINTDLMVKLIENYGKRVTVHIIGKGESKDEIIVKLKRVCEVVYHGAVYDVEKKKEIFSKCHAGLNLYKNDLYIGLTVKSIDYFNFGLPVINNIIGDTSEFVSRYNVGINVDEKSVIDFDVLKKMRMNNENIYKFYESNFISDVFIDKLRKIVSDLV